MRPIDADAFDRQISYVCQSCSGGICEFCKFDELQSILDDTQTLDVAPVVHAHWIPQFVSKRGLSDRFSCSHCNELSVTSHMVLNCPYKYCRHCGAKMDGKDGEKNA